MLQEFDIFKAPLKGISLVEAGAGTGKTYNIASLFVRALLEKNILPVNILVLTYTEAATAELKFRLRNRIKESINVLEGHTPEDPFLEEVQALYNSSHLAHLREALYRFDDAPVSTIHGFCQRLLRENPIAFGVAPEFDILTDDAELVQNKIDSYWRDLMSDTSDEYELAIQRFMVDEGVHPDKITEYIKPVLSKRYARVIPYTASPEKFRKEFEDLRSCFREMRSQLKKEKDNLIALLGSGVLNARTYNQNIYQYLGNIMDWIDSEIIPIKPVERLELFSSYMLEKVNKTHRDTFQAPNCLSYVDDYLVMTEKFSNLKLSIINDAGSRIEHAISKAKTDRGVLTYDDLLETVSSGLTHEISAKLRAKYPIALIDEFQDTDPVQYSIFKTIYSNTENSAIYMIGDPKQAIYKFRGADIHTYLRARKDAHYKFSLGYNYRSNAKIIQAVNEIFNQAEHPFLLDDLTFKPAQFPKDKERATDQLKYKDEIIPQLQILEYRPESKKADKIRNEVAESAASEIVDLLRNAYTIDGCKLKESDIAILVRTNSQAVSMQEVLRNRGVRSVIRNRESVYISTESEELLHILRAIENPAYEDGLRAALATELLGFRASEILNLSQDEYEWEELTSKFRMLNEQWKLFGLSSITDYLMHDLNIEKRLAAHVQAERRITNMYHLIELLDKAERESRLPPNGLVRFLEQKQADSSQTSDEEVIRLESDEQLVQIVTVHASKGLEYSVVFCPFLWEGIQINDQIPDIFHKNGATFIDLGTQKQERNSNRLLSLSDELAETVRLTYVALTRSKTACFVHAVEQIRFEFSPLSCLTEGQEVLSKRLTDVIFLDRNQYKKIHDDASFNMMKNLRNLNESAEIEVREAVKHTTVLSKISALENEDLNVRSFQGQPISTYPRLLSFSSLSDNARELSFQTEKSGFDYDETETAADHSQTLIKNVFSLPKGAKTGTMLHNILEHIDFGEEQGYREIIEKEVVRAGLEDSWTPTITKLINDLLNHELTAGIRLVDLKRNDRIDEMEFHFPVSDINFRSLLKLIRNGQEDVSEDTKFGYLKGFIDLTFRVNGRYYILDYKSNHLGDNLEDYNSIALQQEIKHSYYDLQYHLYTIALHRLLSSNLTNYSYENDFGGVFYVFLRGVDINTPGSSVYFIKPSSEVISRLDEFFKGGVQ